MKTNTIYVEVPCSEPPKKSSVYITDLGALFYSIEHKEWSSRWFAIEPDWWLEKREDVIVMTKEEFKNYIQTTPKAKCPECGSENIIMFTSDLDMCKHCKHTF